MCEEATKNEEQVKEVLPQVISGWIMIEENPIPTTPKSGIIMGDASSLEVTDFKSFLGMFSEHPYTGKVIASGVVDCPVGVTVAFGGVANMNRSAYAKFNKKVYKLLRASDILYYV